MSIGYGGTCIKEVETDTEVYFRYSVYNGNDNSVDEYIEDGIIYIKKVNLAKAVYREKIKKIKGKKHTIIKCIEQPNDWNRLLKSGDIQVINNSQMFICIDGIDGIAIRLIANILDDFQHKDYAENSYSVYW